MKKHSGSDQAEFLEQDAGVQRFNQQLVIPMLESGGDQGHGLRPDRSLVSLAELPTQHRP